MLKLGKLTDYATVLLAAMAAEPARLFVATELSASTQVSPPTVAKLMKQLQRGGLVMSVRGAKGGYRLAHAPEAITVADVITAIEGPIAVTDCAVHDGGCAIEAGCVARGTFRLINVAVRQALEAVTLADMASSVKPTARKTAEALEFPLHFSPSNSTLTSQVSTHVRRR